MAPEKPCFVDQSLPGSPSVICASPAFGALKAKAPLKLRNATATRTFFDSADYQLAAMQATEGKDVGIEAQQASADWRALVKCGTQASSTSTAHAYTTIGSNSYQHSQIATPGTQPLCRGAHRPSRLSQGGF